MAALSWLQNLEFAAGEAEAAARGGGGIPSEPIEEDHEKLIMMVIAEFLDKVA